MKNLFEVQSSVPPEELVEKLAESGAVRIERIESWGHRSPDGFWYDQDRSEWVALLAGAATLRFAGSQETVHMKPGDWILIEAHRKHRVEWTAPDTATVWLAVFHEHSE